MTGYSSPLHPVISPSALNVAITSACVQHIIAFQFFSTSFSKRAVSKMSPGTCNGVCAVRRRAQLVEDADLLTSDLENTWKPGKLLCKAAGAVVISTAVSYAQLDVCIASHAHLGLQYPTRLLAQVKGSKFCVQFSVLHRLIHLNSPSMDVIALMQSDAAELCIVCVICLSRRLKLCVKRHAEISYDHQIIFSPTSNALR